MAVRLNENKEKQITKKLDVCSFLFWVSHAVCILCAVFWWPPLCIACGLPILLCGVLHLVTAHKGWDRFYSFYVGGMADSYRERHIHTIVAGVFCILIGIAISVVLLLLACDIIVIK